MHAFDLKELSEQRPAAGERYLEFLRVPALTLGLYALPVGDIDPQKPHTEDEFDYVASEAGRPIYAALGFTPTNEMSLVLEQHSTGNVLPGR